jgi:hypothetical protein
MWLVEGAYLGKGIPCNLPRQRVTLVDLPEDGLQRIA